MSLNSPPLLNSQLALCNMCNLRNRFMWSHKKHRLPHRWSSQVCGNMSKVRQSIDCQAGGQNVLWEAASRRCGYFLQMWWIMEWMSLPAVIWVTWEPLSEEATTPAGCCAAPSLVARERSRGSRHFLLPSPETWSHNSSTCIAYLDSNVGRERWGVWFTP